MESRICVMCGSQFSTEYRTTISCSVECAQERQRQRSKLSTVNRTDEREAELAVKRRERYRAENEIAKARRMELGLPLDLAETSRHFAKLHAAAKNSGS